MSALNESPTIHEPVQMVNLTMGKWTELGQQSYWENASLDDYSYAGPFCFVQNARIGKFANIAAAVRIGPTMHPMDRPTLHHFTYRRQWYGFDDHDDEDFFAWRASQVATIGHDTWLGHGAIIMPGVTVGDGAVVGSGAVVTKDVPPYGIAVGVPAKTIRFRFSEDIIHAMQAIAWWDWSHETLKERLADFCGSAEEFVSRYGEVS